ncbi:hypothetical protein R1sor_025826 [Riccia sorocarpa]|uniref:Uncharacterized protein n=1 Tax=Riccia sorocarpa TaxID=122646 RepID=A0ABD3GA83_9MARC
MACASGHMRTEGSDHGWSTPVYRTWRMGQNLNLPSDRDDDSREFDDAAVRFLIQQHIDILQRMIAPMVAQKEMLASWLTDRIIHQLRRQVVRYLDTFKGEKFQVSFDRLITRTVSGTPVCLAHSKADHDYERATTNLATSPACDHEQHEVETGQNPLKRKTSSSHTLAPGTSIRPVVAAYGVVNHEENEENHCKSWIQAYSEKSSCKRNRLRRLKSTEGTIEDVEVDYESEEREL